MILPIVTYGASALRNHSALIDKGDNFILLADQMFATLKNAQGIGLAGPQVAVSKSVFIIDTSPLNDVVPVLEKVCINPEILCYGNEPGLYEEGCLSIPGIFENVKRPLSVEVRYRDIHFDWKEEVLEGIAARIFQHEYDHLQGILFIDRLSPLKRKMLKGKLNKIRNNNR
ncbi:MAG TPA: peptide deformylase [Prolixibacteraceae bacterium]|nr:peptide deformylase [Prolixibacteraceae bacterium]